MAKSYCPCKTCTTFNCDDCLCMAQTGCIDDIPDDNEQLKQ